MAAEEQSAGIKAGFVYLGLVGSALGRLRFEGGVHRRSAQLLEEILEGAVEEWIRRHPKESPLVVEKLREFHAAILRNADIVRDSFEGRDS